MKKVLKVLSAAMLAAVVAVGATTSAFAAAEENKINAAEQKVLDALGGTVNMNGTQKTNKVQWINQANDCFTKVDMTDDQATQVIAKIDELKKYLEGLKKSSIDEMTDAEVEGAVKIANEAAGIVKAKLTFDRKAKTVSYVLEGNKKDESSKATPAGDNPIKTTGLDVPGVTAVAGIAVLAVSAAGIYVISTSKKKETVDA